MSDTEQLYYVQDTRSVVGNCASWWGPDNCGYVCDLSEAGLYTAEQVRSMRQTDVAWPKEVVEKLVRKHVNVGRLHKSRETCPVCEGDGLLRDEPCSACKALGHVETITGRWS